MEDFCVSYGVGATFILSLFFTNEIDSVILDAMGIAVSAGSACSSGTLKKSRVLDAFGVADDVAERTIRVSLGWNTSAHDLDQFIEAWKKLS